MPCDHLKPRWTWLSRFGLRGLAPCLPDPFPAGRVIHGLSDCKNSAAAPQVQQRKFMLMQNEAFAAGLCINHLRTPSLVSQSRSCCRPSLTTLYHDLRRAQRHAAAPAGCLAARRAAEPALCPHFAVLRDAAAVVVPVHASASGNTVIICDANLIHSRAVLVMKHHAASTDLGLGISGLVAAFGACKPDAAGLPCNGQF